MTVGANCYGYMEDRPGKGRIVVSVFGIIIYAGPAAEYPEGLAAWCANPYTSHLMPDYEFTPLHPHAYQDALVLAYRRFTGTKYEPRLQHQ
jgi:hypothetical protein